MPNEKDDAAWWLHLDKLRRSIDLRLDREGHWWHDGRAFEHQGIIDTLNRGLDLNHSTGEAIVRVGEQWCFIKVVLPTRGLISVGSVKTFRLYSIPNSGQPSTCRAFAMSVTNSLPLKPWVD